jgi:phage shock protein E
MGLFSQLFQPGIDQLEPAQVQEKIKHSPRPYLLDVRTPQEYRQEHISGAELIPLDELTSRVNRLPKEREIICICESGSRSIVAAHRLNSMGYKVSNMKGGMNRWTRAGLPTKSGPGK